MRKGPARLIEIGRDNARRENLGRKFGLLIVSTRGERDRDGNCKQKNDRADSYGVITGRSSVSGKANIVGRRSSPPISKDGDQNDHPTIACRGRRANWMQRHVAGGSGSILTLLLSFRANTPVRLGPRNL
jgi:hypothetical protein